MVEVEHGSRDHEGVEATPYFEYATLKRRAALRRQVYGTEDGVDEVFELVEAGEELQMRRLEEALYFQPLQYGMELVWTGEDIFQSASEHACPARNQDPPYQRAPTLLKHR